MTDSAANSGPASDVIWAGTLAATRTELMHTTCSCGEAFVAEVHRTVASADADLVELLREGILGRVSCPACGTSSSIDVPVILHDEEARRVALVLPESMRHRDLEERAEMLLAMARDKSAPVPAYARNFSVVFPGGVVDWMAGPHELGGSREKRDDLAKHEAEITRREVEAQRREAEVSRREAELRAQTEELDEKRRSMESLSGDTGVSAAAIADVEPAKITLEHASVQALLDMLEDKDHRLAAALELCERGEQLGVAPIFSSLRRMTRGEAAKAIPAVVKLGDAAVPHLIDGLRSRKTYLRQGSALALGVLRNGDGIEPLCDLLTVEPTEVWREVARAIGEMGSYAVTALAKRLANQDSDIRERIAWAMAYVAARTGRGTVETLAQGRDLAAAGAARRALELAASARDSNVEVRGQDIPHDQTVNRAFSRRFFEAVAAGLPAAELERIANETDTGTVQLDEAELLEADEDLLEEAGSDDEDEGENAHHD